MRPRDAWFHLPDDVLLSQCEIDTYRASGPGGQKRNKTSSAVRLRHPPSGLIVIAEESRSQHENKAKALKRLRRAFVLKIREPIDPSSIAQHPTLQAIRNSEGRLLAASEKTPGYWPAIATLLDVLVHCQGEVSTSAEWIGTSTANVISLFALHPTVWQEVNRIRATTGLKSLKNSQ